MHPKKRALYYAIFSFAIAIALSIFSLWITFIYAIIGILCLILYKVFDHINLDLANAIITIIFPISILIIIELILKFI